MYRPSSIAVIVKSTKIQWIRMEATRNAYRCLIGNSLGKHPLERPRRTWVDNIKMDLDKIGCGDGRWWANPLQNPHSG